MYGNAIRKVALSGICTVIVILCMGQQCVSPGIDGLALSAGDRNAEEVSAANQVPDAIDDPAADEAVANDVTDDDRTEEDLAPEGEADDDSLLDDESTDDDGQDETTDDGEDEADDDQADDDEEEPADEEIDDDERVVVAANTEQLDDPVGLTLADGSDILAAGVGLLGGQPDTISIEIPDGVTVEQVLLYWEGQAETAGEQGDTDEIVLEGSIIVEGVRIGGPTRFGPLPDFWTSTYRADITGLDLIAVGPNDLTIEGLDFSQRNNGVGILVVVDDGVNTTDLQLKDGNDLAFFDYAPPLDTTAPVTFDFPASTEDRTASLSLFVSSVALEDPTSTFGRPTIIRIWVDDVFVEDLVDELENSDGPEWDTVVRLVDIPAGATSLTVQILSEDAGTGQFAGNLPASLTWSAAGLALLPAVPPLPPVPEGEGCTPGYWQQEQHFGDWTPPAVRS